MIKAYRRTSFRYDFIRENHEKEINFSFKFVSQEGKDKKKPHFKGLNLHFEFFNIKIEDYIVKHENDNILILVDLLSGSPFNSVIPQLQNERIYVVTGVNLPMLLEVGMQKDKIGFEELCSLAKTSGIAGIVTKDDILKGSE